MSRLLVIMGSGETTPTMVTPHQRVIAEVGPSPTARLLDTPYGFQENADDVTARSLEYFARNVGVPVEPIRLRDVDELTAGALERAHVAAREADWLFAGPGSPSYLLRQWNRTRLPAILLERLHRPGATVFASAAAVTLGTHAVPVYEVYKAGHAPRWLDGLDVLGAVGWPVVVIPHYDNAEGGTHDTRFCYLGERRLATLEAELPDGTWILGVDEHTAATLDLDAGAVRIDGRGTVTVRAGGRSTAFGAGVVGFEELLAAATGQPVSATSAAHADAVVTAATDAEERPPATPFLDALAAAERDFDAALAAGAAVRAGEAALAVESLLADWAADTNVSDEVDRARATLRRMLVRLAELADGGLHDHRDVVAPHVESLLDLRRAARAEGRYDVADDIRDRLGRGGVEVRDTPDGAEWRYDGRKP